MRNANAEAFSVLVAISCLGLLGNIIGIATIVAKRFFLKSITHWYILQIFIAETVFLITVPFSAAQIENNAWIYDEWACTGKNAVTYIHYYALALFLMILCVDRYFAVCHRSSKTVQKIRKLKPAVAITICVWVISILLAIPTMLYSRVGGMEPNCKCTFVFSNQAPITLSDCLKSVGLEESCHRFYSEVNPYCRPNVLSISEPIDERTLGEVTSEIVPGSEVFGGGLDSMSTFYGNEESEIDLGSLFEEYENRIDEQSAVGSGLNNESSLDGGETNSAGEVDEGTGNGEGIDYASYFGETDFGSFIGGLLDEGSSDGSGTDEGPSVGGGFDLQAFFEGGFEGFFSASGSGSGDEDVTNANEKAGDVFEVPSYCHYSDGSNGRIAFISFNFTVNLLVIVVMLVFYGLIIGHSDKFEATESSDRPQSDKGSKRMTKICAVFAFIFTLCWLPLNATEIAILNGIEASNRYCENLIVDTTLLAFFNSAFNPFIYCLLGIAYALCDSEDDENYKKPVQSSENL